jgi:putative effector of murein hydrolase
MVVIFTALCGLRFSSPELAEDFSVGLTPAVSLIKTWLPIFFVPPLVVLPLKLHLLKGMGMQFVSVIIMGAALSMSSAGLFAQFVNKLFPLLETERSATAVVSSGAAPSLPKLSHAAVATAALMVGSKLLSHRTEAAFNIVQAAFGFSASLTGYITGTKLPSKVKKVVHPVLCCAAMTTALLTAFGLLNGVAPAAALTLYFGSGSLRGAGDIISSMLGPAILSFGVQLFQYRAMLLKNAVKVTATTAFSAGFGLSSSAVLTRAFKLSPPQTALATLTRCISTPLVLAGSRLTGADPSLSAFAVVITGILGASLGESLLGVIGVKDPVSVGVAVGAGAHGLGTAAVSYDPVKFASAVVSMTLTGLWTVTLLSYTPFREKLIKIALL